MNVNKVLTNAYEERTLGENGKNEPKTNPTCRGAASGEAGSKPKKCCSPPFRCGVSVKDYTCNVPYNMVK